MWHKHHKLWVALITSLTVIVIAFIGAGMYFFNVACVRGHKSFIMPTFSRFPLVEILSGINKTRIGYFLKDGSSVNQLKKNKLPILFIHGKKDTFVPKKWFMKTITQQTLQSNYG